MDDLMRAILQALDEFLRPESDPRQRRKRADILTAATRQFIAHGYRKTAVEDVARDAGIAKGTIYLYYRNKAALLFHAVAFEKERYLTQLASLRELELTPFDRLRGLVAIGLIMSRRLPLMNRLTGRDREFELALQEIDGALLEYLNEQQLSMMARLIDEAAGHTWPRGELRKRAGVLVDLMYAVATSDRMNLSGSDLEAEARLVADIIVTGVTQDIRQSQRWSRGTMDAVRAAVSGE